VGRELKELQDQVEAQLAEEEAQRHKAERLAEESRVAEEKRLAKMKEREREVKAKAAAAVQAKRDAEEARLKEKV